MNWMSWVGVALLLASTALGIWWAERHVRRQRAKLDALDSAWGLGLLDDLAFLARRREALTHEPQRIGGPGIRVLALAVDVPFVVAVIWNGQSPSNPSSAGTRPTVDPAASGIEQQPSSTPRARSMDEVLASLSTRLQREGGTVDDWLLLGRGYASQGKFSDAETALHSALTQAPERSDVEAEWIEMRAKAQGTYAAQDQARLIALAALAPTQAKPLWLLAEFAEQNGDARMAEKRWREVLGLLPPDSPDRAVIMQRLETLAGGHLPGQTSGGAAMEIRLELSPEASTALPPSATVFVFARSPDSPMPVAAHRLTLGELPTTVHLDDSHLIQPGRSLSSYGPLLVGARVSVSGDARPAPGDIEAEPIRVESVDSGNRLQLNLSRIRP